MTDTCHEYNFVILGAGPAGLAFASELLRHGETSFVVLEKESCAGGLCRSEIVDGSPLDIGGCHLLDTRNRGVCDYLFSYLPQENWTRHKRVNTISLDECTIGFPFENYLWQLPEAIQTECVKSIKNAQLSAEASPDNFHDWIIAHFGEYAARLYMLPYNQKIWSTDLSKLGVYWLNKLPPITYEDIERSVKEKKSPEIFAAHNSFYYPHEHAFGDVFGIIADSLDGHIIYNCPAEVTDGARRCVNNKFFGKHIINTAAWSSMDYTDVPDSVRDAIGKLRHTSVDIDYFSDYIDTGSQAIYCPDMSKPYHRVILRYNYNRAWRGYWTETNAARATEKSKGSFHYRNAYAYPVNTIEKPQAIKTVLDWFAERNIIGLGRWGQWQHFNSDAVIESGIRLANQLLGKA